MKLNFLKKILRFVYRPVFIIDIKNGEASLLSGKVSNKLVIEFSSIAKHQDILRGTIYGLKSSKGIKLDFSPSIDDKDRQRFRNVWNVYRS
jgi:hypothetical protein